MFKKESSNQTRFFSDDSFDSFDDLNILHHDEDFTISHVDPVDEDVEPNKPPPKVLIEVPESKTVDLYLFHVHEEGPKLYLFCKHPVGPDYFTICVEITDSFYYLQFLPIQGHEYEILDEVNFIAHKNGGSVISSEMKEFKYSFEIVQIPEVSNYLNVVLSSTTNLSRIPPNGINYSHVFGLTTTLTENFYIRRNIKCPSWIRATHCEKKSRNTTVPMLTVPNIESIIPLDLPKTPPMNICAISIRSMFHTNEIYMISLRVLQEWDIMEFSGSGNFVINLICTTSGSKINDKFISENKKSVRAYRNESDLLSSFVRLIDDYDIDILTSFGLISNDIPLLFSRLKLFNVKDWWRIGRLRRSTPIKNGKINPNYALSGRIPCDIRISCMDQMKAKSNDLSAAVHTQFGFDRQYIDHYEVVQNVSDYDKLINLINYNSRDTLFVLQLLNAREVLPLGLHIAQLSGCQWSRVLLSQVSFWCESLLVNAFFNCGFVIPDKCITNQPKYPAFPGGLVLQPKRGFYETCIAVLDYVSLYPSIIIEYNICFTTVDLRNPDAEESKRNQRKGVLPQIMSELLKQREEVKNEMKKLINKLAKLEQEIEKKFRKEINSEDNILFKNDKFVPKVQFRQCLSSQKTSSISDIQKVKTGIELEIQRLNTKQEAIKVLANAVYGYLGYRHSRFQANPLAALIAMKGREILQRTVEIVEKNGRDSIVYGDTDSVMINTGLTDPEAALNKGKEIAEIVTNQFHHLKFAVEGIFLKMLVVQKKRYVALVYDGPNKSHQLTKGIELVRRDWCGLTKYVSAFILEQFLYCSDKDTAISRILGELTRIAKMMRNNGELKYSAQFPQIDMNQKHNEIKKDKTILPAICFPQTYGFTSNSTDQKNSLKQETRISMQSQATDQKFLLKNSIKSGTTKEIDLQSRNENNFLSNCFTQNSFQSIHLKQHPFKSNDQKYMKLNSNTSSIVSMLREYGISSKFASTEDSSQNERITPIEKINVEHLIIHVTLSKPIDKYQDKMSPHVMVAKRMEDRGEHVTSNTTIPYVISNFDSREIGEKARIPDELKGLSEIDSEWYLSNQILSPIWRLCEPFGGIEASMISRALDLVIPQTYGLPERDECVEVIIPHLTELYFSCLKCNEIIYIGKKMKNNLLCKKCSYLHNWKYVANQLNLFIKQFIEKATLSKCDGNLCDFQTLQIPLCRKSHGSCKGELKLVYSCAGVFNTLKYFSSLFEKSNNPEDDEFLDFREYMKNLIEIFLQLHGFSRIKLTSVFSYSSSETSKEVTPIGSFKNSSNS